MLKKLTMPIILLITIIAGNSEGAIANDDSVPEIQILTMECLYSVSNNYNIPMPILVAILKVEGGAIGTKFRNMNGTTDLGPALINSKWISKIKKYGITTKQVQNNGCVNVMVLGWILAKELKRTNSIWQAVGRFHSSNIQQQQAYVEKVYEVFLEMNNKTKYSGAQKIVSTANLPYESVSQ